MGENSKRRAPMFVVVALIITILVLLGTLVTVICVLLPHEGSNGDVIKVEKQYLEQDWVYTAYENREYKLPKINISSKQADEINGEINELITKIKNGATEPYATSYNWYINKSVLSLVVESQYSNDYTSYLIYNINMATGKLCKNSELLEIVGMSEKTFLNNAKLAYGQKFSEIYKDVSPTDQQYIEMYQKTISKDNYGMSVPMFLNEDGNLFVAAKIYSLAGSEWYYYLVNVSGEHSVESDVKYTLAKRESVQILRLPKYIDVIVDLDGFVYLELPTSILSLEDVQIRNSLSKISEQCDTYNPKGYIGYDETQTTLYAVKLDIEKVVSAYMVNVGNSGEEYIVFLKEDGTLATLSCYDLVYNAKITLKNVTGVSNVVSVMQNRYTLTPYAIDNMGNEIELMQGKTNNVGSSSNSYPYNLSKRSYLQAIDWECVRVWASTDGNAYISLIGNWETFGTEQNKQSLKRLAESFTDTKIKDYVGYEGENSLPAYKLNMSRVLGAYFVNVGNGGNLFFVFIKENGKVAYLSYNSMIYEGKIVIKDINELSNIVSIVYNDMVPYAVDINGNEVELYKYINY